MQNPVEDVLAAAPPSPGCAFTAPLVSHSGRNESGTTGQQDQQAELDLHGCCSAHHRVQTEPVALGKVVLAKGCVAVCYSHVVVVSFSAIFGWR